EMYIEGGLSAITDAVYLSTQRLVKDSEEYGSGYKRAVILISDGAEESSFYRTGQALLLLREKKIPVYAIGFPQALGRQGVKVQERARKYLIKLADESGGRVYFVDAPTDVRSFANSILNDIRAH